MERQATALVLAQPVGRGVDAAHEATMPKERDLRSGKPLHDEGRIRFGDELSHMVAADDHALKSVIMIRRDDADECAHELSLTVAVMRRNSE